MSKPSSQFQQHLLMAWYKGNIFLYLLLPVMVIYRLLMAVRSSFYRLGILNVYQAPVPVIVVGNISLGGTGKTPLVIALARLLKGQGYKPGIISRGYGSRAASYPYEVTTAGSSHDCGDEPLMMARATQVPVFIGADRQQAIAALLASHDCDVILSDDGLQHYALGRDIEIVVIDGERQLGNHYCLPMGPLREPASRLKRADFIVINGDQFLKNPTKQLSNISNMSLKRSELINLADQSHLQLERLQAEPIIHAVAGIGNPERFFTDLEREGLSIQRHAFADHYDYKPEDFSFQPAAPIIMTEKDAVKIDFKLDQPSWFLPVFAELEPEFTHQLILQLSQLKREA